MASNDDNVKIGFVGLGRMGTAIAGRLADAGYDLTVWNRTAGKDADLVKRGAVSSETLHTACSGREVVMSMLADDEALRATSDDIAAALGAGGIHVAMGTHSVAAITEIAATHAAAGQSLVAAPVLGRPDAAEAGQLGIVAGGAPEAVEVCQPLFEVFGRRTFEAGSRPESASAIKLTNNFVLCSAIETLAEAFGLSSHYDVKREVLFDVLTDGLFSAPAYKIYGRLIADENYDNVGFTTKLGLKDVGLVLDAAGDDVVMPTAEVLKQRLQSAIDNGDGDRDWAVLGREQERSREGSTTRE
jgi:3-hydroxyisobutyrate dehydrogenase-like beta-hydroxyacid dehydrogenase